MGTAALGGSSLWVCEPSSGEAPSPPRRDSLSSGAGAGSSDSLITPQRHMPSASRITPSVGLRWRMCPPAHVAVLHPRSTRPRFGSQKSGGRAAFCQSELCARAPPGAHLHPTGPIFRLPRMCVLFHIQEDSEESDSLREESSCLSVSCDSYFLQDRLPMLPEPTVLSHSKCKVQCYTSLTAVQKVVALPCQSAQGRKWSPGAAVGTRPRRSGGESIHVALNPKPSSALMTSLFKWQKFQRDLSL